MNAVTCSAPQAHGAHNSNRLYHGDSSSSVYHIVYEMQQCERHLHRVKRPTNRCIIATHRENCSCHHHRGHCITNHSCRAQGSINMAFVDGTIVKIIDNVTNQ